MPSVRRNELDALIHLLAQSRIALPCPAGMVAAIPSLSEPPFLCFGLSLCWRMPRSILTSAMQAGVTDHVWNLEEMVGVLDAVNRQVA